MHVVLSTSLLISSACGAFAQSVEPAPAFEVASVKVSNVGESQRVRADAITVSPAGVTMTNIRLKSVVQWAYRLQPIQVTGPGWLESNRYDIVAKASGAVSKDQLRQMVQTLLAERFKLTCHKESKEMPAYVVTVAKGGHKMKPSEGEGEMDVKPTGKGLIVGFTHVTMEQLTDMTQSPLQGVVVDQTGLKGAWDFTLDASSFAMSQPTGIDDAIGMVIQAINGQLGLKIEQKKVPAELLTVDHAEKVPIEN